MTPGGTQRFRAPAGLRYLRPVRAIVTQFDGATTMRVPPLAAGLLVATARRTHPDVDFDVVVRRREPGAVAAALAVADVLGLSLYAWNERYTLAVAAEAKRMNPQLRIVAGGPSVPRRPVAASAFLADNAAIDVLAHGEGERTFARVLAAWRDDGSLAVIPGLTMRVDGRVIATGPRARLAADDLRETASPYLDGTFDALLASGELADVNAAVFETNRGCPFACTFCDWGQAIESRVHELPLDRIEAELRWAAARGVEYVYLVDANFGIRPRDVGITEWITRLAAETGFPRFVYFHLTKNATEKNLRTAETLLRGGVGTHVALSMQDFEPEVLAAIRRDNIPSTYALALRERCHAEGLATTNELLLGLPAQSLASFRRSIVQALTPFPRDSFFLYPTRMLVNAEIADPEYRARFGLATRRVPVKFVDPSLASHVDELDEIVVESHAMSVGEWREAFTFGFMLAALVNQHLLATTLHVLAWSLQADVAAFVDALLWTGTPRLTALRAEIERFADAILGEVATSLPVPGFGPARREPVDGVAARVFEDVAGFADEVAAVAREQLGTARGALLADAAAWDAFLIPTGEARMRTFGWDWPAYTVTAGERPTPRQGPVTVRRTLPSPAHDTATALDRFLAAGYAKRPRLTFETVPAVS